MQFLGLTSKMNNKRFQQLKKAVITEMERRQEQKTTLLDIEKQGIEREIQKFLMS